MVTRHVYIFSAPWSKEPIECIAESYTTALDRLRAAKVETRSLVLERVSEDYAPQLFQQSHMPVSMEQHRFGVKRIIQGSGFKYSKA